MYCSGCFCLYIRANVQAWGGYSTLASSSGKTCFRIETHKKTAIYLLLLSFFLLFLFFSRIKQHVVRLLLHLVSSFNPSYYIYFFLFYVCPLHLMFQQPLKPFFSSVCQLPDHHGRISCHSSCSFTLPIFLFFTSSFLFFILFPFPTSLPIIKVNLFITTWPYQTWSLN